MELIKEGPSVVILAGGLGTRLRPITETIPKPMVDILGKPFLEYKIRQLKDSGMQKIILCVGHFGKMIEDYFGEGEKFGVNIQYAYEKELLGTAGALKNAEEFINTDSFIVINGDTYSTINLRDLFLLHQTHNLPVTMAVTSATNPTEQELVEMDNLIVNKFHKRDTIEHQNHIKENPAPLINAGAYTFDKIILNLIPKGEKISLEMDIFPNLLQKIKGFIYEGYIKDLANIQLCEELKKDIIKGMTHDN